MADIWAEPTEEQKEQASLAALDLIEVVNRLIREGIDPRVVLAGMGYAACDTITCIFGATAVAPWFLKQAMVVAEHQRPN